MLWLFFCFSPLPLLFLLVIVSFTAFFWRSPLSPVHAETKAFNRQRPLLSVKVLFLLLSFPGFCSGVSKECRRGRQKTAVILCQFSFDPNSERFLSKGYLLLLSFTKLFAFVH